MTAPRFETGLVVGKFAPLHRGHELVIDTAHAQCASVVILSYSKPELDGYSPARRRTWLEAAFPNALVRVLDEAEVQARGLSFELPRNDAPDAEHHAFVARVCHELLGIVVDAVFTSETYGQPFADALTEYYRAEHGRQGRVSHVAVDPERRQVPISGSRIRSAPYAHQSWVSPPVYASLIQRVVMLGAESSGKSTLARALGLAHRTTHVEEYGRELWLTQGGRLDRSDLVSIAEQQVRREEAALPSCRDFLFCDTSPFTTALYSQLMFGAVPEELERLAQREYALTVYCTPDFPFVQDGTRGSLEFRAKQDALTLAELERRGTPYLRVHGSVEARVAQVLGVLVRE